MIIKLEKKKKKKKKKESDFDNMGLIAIAKGCWKLKKFEVVGYKKITGTGVKTLTSLLGGEEKEEETGWRKGRKNGLLPTCIGKKKEKNIYAWREKV